jgi:hypothetical protein
MHIYVFIESKNLGALEVEVVCFDENVEREESCLRN